MKPLALSAILVVVALFSKNVFAANDIKPGEYLQQGSTLTVKPLSNKRQAFAIQSLGANGHTCELDGFIQQNKAILDTGEGEKRCIVSFQPTEQGIIVDYSQPGECRFFCGARASFSGTYIVPEKGCSNADRQSARKRFIGFYKQKNYVAARAQLEPIVKKCDKTLDFFEDADIRNNLAITQYHLNDYAGCLKTLEPLKEYAEMTSEDLQGFGGGGITDVDKIKPIAKSARTNIGLCSTKVKTK